MFITEQKIVVKVYFKCIYNIIYIMFSTNEWYINVTPLTVAVISTVFHK